MNPYVLFILLYIPLLVILWSQAVSIVWKGWLWLIGFWIKRNPDIYSGGYRTSRVNANQIYVDDPEIDVPNGPGL